MSCSTAWLPFIATGFGSIATGFSFARDALAALGKPETDREHQIFGFTNAVVMTNEMRWYLVSALAGISNKFGKRMVRIVGIKLDIIDCPEIALQPKSRTASNQFMQIETMHLLFASQSKLSLNVVQHTNLALQLFGLAIFLQRLDNAGNFSVCWDLTKNAE